MNDFMEAFKALNLTPVLYGTAFVLGVLLRFARGMVPSFGPSKTYFAAMGLGVLGAVVNAVEGQDWRVVGRDSLALIAAVLVVQFALQKMADKLPWLPKDNEWVK